MTPEERITGIAEFLDFVHRDNDNFGLFELRGPGASDKRMLCFLGTDTMHAAHCALKMESLGADAYYTLNPVFLGSMYAIHSEKNKPVAALRTARDNTIQCRNLLLIDIDPVRPSGTAATDAQRRAAGLMAMCVRDHLSSIGWPLPTILDSGNGVHLLYFIERVDIDQPVIRHALIALGVIASDGICKIDTSVSNAARIARLPWTWNKKAQKYSRVLCYAPTRERVSAREIMDLAMEGGYRAERHTGTPDMRCALDTDGVEDLIEEFADYLILDNVTYDGNITYFSLAECPFKGDAHRGQETGHGKTCIIHRPGSIGFQCFSDDCDGFGFRDLLRLLERKTGSKPSMEIFEHTVDLTRLATRWGGVDVINGCKHVD